MIKLNGGGLFQWDIDREITVTDIEFDELHFDNVFLSKALVTKPANSSGGVIPNVLLQFATPITVYAVKNEKVLEAATFEVTAKAKPEDYFVFDENDYSGIIALLGGEETTPSIAGVHEKINDVNALGIKALANKGVTVPEDATTNNIMQSISDIESGQEAHATFWDKYQQNGNRTNYAYAFYGECWTDELFKPKHPIIPTSANNMFSSATITSTPYILNIDFSNCANFTSAFYNCKGLTEIGVVDMRNASNGTGNHNVFMVCKNLVTIQKIIMKDTMTIQNTMFQECTALVHILFEGNIGKTINFQWSPLDLESAISIINALVNYSGTANAFKYTVKFSSHTTELLNAAGNTAPNGTTWLEYAFTKGWNIE